MKYRLCSVKIIFSSLAILALLNSGFSQNFNVDSIFQRIQNTDDEKDFENLFEIVSLDLEMNDSTKMALSQIASVRAKELGLEYYYAKFIFRQAIVHTVSGNYSKGINLANESLDIFLRQEEYLEASACYNTIGSSLAERGDLVAGKDYLKKAVHYCELEKDDPFYSRRGIHSIVYANILRKMNLLDSALIITKRALDVSIENEIKSHEIFCLVNLGGIQKSRKQFTSAKGYLSRVIALLGTTKMYDVEAAAYNHLTDIAILEEKSDSTFFFLEKGLDACKRSNTFLPIQLELLGKKEKWYSENGLSDLALEVQLEHFALKDSFYSVEKEKEIQLVQSQFKTQEKDRDIELLSQKAAIQTLEIKQKNQMLIIGVVVFLFVLAAIFFIYKQRETKKKQSQTELEQRFLRSQLNPHFISNAMVAVQSFMLKNDGESAALYLTKFSKLMREILENSRKEFITVEEEISMLRNYLDIHKLRLGSFDYSIDVDENIDPETDTIPPMFVQPFVENAVEHGIADLKEGGKINLKFKKDGDYISIVVNDNGKGLQGNNGMDHASLSTTIIQERMSLFNRSLKKKIQLVVDNLNGEKGEAIGTKVKLKVPYSNTL
ncbi:MAG: histidine kinase [Ekhidna sp.]